MEVVLDVQAQLAPLWGPWSSWGQDLRCQQAQSLPTPGNGVLHRGIQPAGGPVMFDQPPDAFCCLIPARRSAGGRARRPNICIQGP